MIDQITLSYPSWYILLCLFLGIVGAFALYSSGKVSSDSPGFLSFLLGILRALAISILAFLLLNPFIKLIQQNIEKPRLVFVIDQSSSVSKNTPEEYDRTISSLANLENELSDKYEINEVYFGSSVDADTANVGHGATDISSALEYVYDVYQDKRLAGTVLVTDGLYNQGRNPLYTATSFTSPVYTIGVGDTTIHKDLILKNVFHNKIVYLNDQFGVDVDVQGYFGQGESTVLQLRRKDSSGKWVTLDKKTLRIGNNDFFETAQFITNAKHVGLNHYRVQVSSLSGEKQTANNFQDFFVEVLDARLKIKILTASPHPDISTLNKVLGQNENYILETMNIADAPNLLETDYVIFHNLPNGNKAFNKIIQEANQRKIPRLFFVGNQVNVPLFNAIQNVVNLKGNNSNYNEVQPVLVNGFNSFELSDQTKSQLESFPPVFSPFGETKEQAGANTLLYQKIGSINTKYPLLAFEESQGVKTAVFMGEGVWKWKLNNFIEYGNFDIIDDVLSQTISYTSIKEDKRKLRVESNKKLYTQNERIQFAGEIYNDSYQLNNSAEMLLKIASDDKKRYDFTFSRTGEKYDLDIGKLPPGNYRWTASSSFNGQQLTHNGQFGVRQLNLEDLANTADFNLLRALSERHNGKFFNASDINNLQTALTNSEQSKGVLISQVENKSLIHYKWIFYILVALLAVEWVLRRYYGSI